MAAHEINYAFAKQSEEERKDYEYFREKDRKIEATIIDKIISSYTVC